MILINFVMTRITHNNLKPAHKKSLANSSIQYVEFPLRHDFDDMTTKREIFNIIFVEAMVFFCDVSKLEREYHRREDPNITGVTI